MSWLSDHTLRVHFMRSNPLLSLVLISYNQERFIADAVSSALEQTYSPLEIIISDDCSKDRTFEIATELAAAYRGPHKIVLNRNERNLGLCANLNSALTLSSGELIVGAAGDDISLPHRCERLAEEWMKPERRWHSIVSDAEVIDASGAHIGIYQNISAPRTLDSVPSVLESGIVGIAGCCHAFSHENFTIFGPIDPRAPGEDDILGFRSLLLGGCYWIPDVLILYRRHGGGLFKDLKALRAMQRCTRIRMIKEDLRACELRRDLYDEYIDVACSKGFFPSEKKEEFHSVLQRRFPYHYFRFVCKYTAIYSGLYLLYLTVCGRYRRGMFYLWTGHHLRLGLRSSLRRLLARVFR